MRYQLSKREEELTRWAVGCALETMRDNLIGDPDDDHNLEAVYDGMIENWQGYTKEELENIQIGLGAFVMQGTGRYGRAWYAERQTALRVEQMKYITEDKTINLKELLQRLANLEELLQRLANLEEQELVVSDDMSEASYWTGYLEALSEHSIELKSLPEGLAVLLDEFKV